MICIIFIFRVLRIKGRFQREIFELTLPKFSQSMQNFETNRLMLLSSRNIEIIQSYWWKTWFVLFSSWFFRMTYWFLRELIDFTLPKFAQSTQNFDLTRLVLMLFLSSIIENINGYRQKIDLKVFLLRKTIFNFWQYYNT